MLRAARPVLRTRSPHTYTPPRQRNIKLTDYDTKRLIASQGTVPSRFSSWWAGLPLVALLLAVWFAPGFVGATDPISQLPEPWSTSSDLFEGGTVVLNADLPAIISDRVAMQHDHRNSNHHSGDGCDGIDCSAVTDPALRDTEPLLPDAPPSAKPGTPVDHLAQPPLRPPRIPV